MDFDGFTCSATLSSPSVTGRFLKKVTSLSGALRQERRKGKGGSEVTRTGQVVKDRAPAATPFACNRLSNIHC